MKTTIAILGLLMLVGCQNQPRESKHARNDPFDRHDAVQRYEPLYQPGSAALVYTPPAARGTEDLDLSREGRGMYALGGVETTIIDTTYVYQDDRQRYDQWGDWSRFERRAVSTSVTIRQR